MSKTHKCDFEGCNVSFNIKYRLIEHQRIHTGEKPYICDYDNCEAKFNRSCHLIEHKRIHTGEKPYVCDYENCDKKFTQLGQLNRHKRTHTGEKPYICDYENCGVKFAHKESLVTHRRIHTGEKPYICNFENCNATFARFSGYIEHIRMHTNERPYICDIKDCCARFINSYDLIIHKRIHTGKKPYMCDYEMCGFFTARSSELVKHKSRMHSPSGIIRQKRQEQWIANILQSEEINFKREHRIEFNCVKDMDTSYARIDFTIDVRSGIMFLEIDENQHRFGEYSISCDLNRMAKVNESLVIGKNNLPIIFVRMNTNTYRIDNKIAKCTKKDRANVLINFIRNFKFDNNSPGMQIQYMYYDVNENKLCIHDSDEYHEQIKNLCLPPII